MAVVSRLPKWVEYGAFILALVCRLRQRRWPAWLSAPIDFTPLSGITTLIGDKPYTAPACYTSPLTSHSLLSRLYSCSNFPLLFAQRRLENGPQLQRSSCCRRRSAVNRDWLAKLRLFARALLWLLRRVAYKTPWSPPTAGAVIRTTHVTGIFTDIGLMMRRKATRRTFRQPQSVTVLHLIVAGFIAGGTFGGRHVSTTSPLMPVCASSHLWSAGIVVPVVSAGA